MCYKRQNKQEISPNFNHLEGENGSVYHFSHHKKGKEKNKRMDTMLNRCKGKDIEAVENLTRTRTAS